MTDPSRPRGRTTMYPKGTQREHYVLAMEGVLYMWLGKTGRVNRSLTEEERRTLAHEYAPAVFDALCRALRIREGDLATAARVCDFYLRRRPWLRP